MNIIKSINQFITSFQLMTELNQASGKVLLATLAAGQACARDLKNCAQHVPSEPHQESFADQADMWLETTASVSGLTAFRNDLISTAEEQEQEIQRLRELCLAHGLDVTDPEEIPF
ncbi:MAG: hypothetical protein RSD49_17520 [Hafnia sp.]